MKITVDKELLYKAVVTADSIIFSKNVNTVLSNCLFNVTKDEMEIISTDNEIAIKTRIEVISDGTMSFLVNGKKFSGILKELPSGELELYVNDKLQIDISSTFKDIKGKYSIIAMDAANYPEIPEFIESDSIEIEQSILREMLKKVIYAASRDTIKPVFNGIYFAIENGNNITAVSTDSRRLSMILRRIHASISNLEGFIIPLKTINEIYKMLEATETCNFTVTDNQCFFRIGKTDIISRIVDGQFPNYKHVIPKDYIIETVIETKSLLDSIRRVVIFASEPSYKVILQFTSGKLIISANSPDLGTAEEEIVLDTFLESDIVLGINAQFLIDSLREIDSHYVKCSVTGQMNPLTLIPQDDPNYISVIMPIQIKPPNE
jgi:DNA polymerase-3 subunit beta